MERKKTVQTRKWQDFCCQNNYDIALPLREDTVEGTDCELEKGLHQMI